MKKNILAFLALGLTVLAPAAALADTEQLDNGCYWSGGVSCAAACDPSGSFFSCDVQPPDCEAKLPTECSAELTVDPNCNVSCEADCSAKCEVNKPTFSCVADCQARLVAECQANVDASCEGECASSGDKTTCKSKCTSDLQASCKSSGSIDCTASCKGNPGSVDCSGSCKASCSGSCDPKASARVSCDGYLRCSSAGKIECQSDFQANCTAKCQTSGGVLVCNGQVVSFSSTVADAKAWIRDHLKISYEADASCEGNSCEASASASCSTTPSRHVPGASLALGVLGMAYGASRLRRRSR